MESEGPEPSRSWWTAPGRTGTATSTHEPGRAAVHVADEQAQPVDLQRLAFLAQHILDHLAVPAHMQLWITCVDAGRMSELNAEHLQASGPTDVLAFPIDSPAEASPDVPALLGDVVICPGVAAAQAADAGHSSQAEMDLLVVHGVLHLLGYDHIEPEERAEMFGLTDRLLKSFRPPEAPR